MSADQTNSCVTPPGSAARPRLFLSYGRNDASPLANRLCVDLEARGFEVWQDTRRIRTGREWEAEITDGLRSTQVLVALLSPHAVRRSLDPGSPDNLDSVCLDEISFARFAHPPKPILPVMAVACEPPFCIFRLDYTDMTQWSQSDDQYRLGLERLIRGLEAALRGESPPYRRWHRRLPSFDFTAYLHEKRKDFVGRGWLFEAIEVWRLQSSRERALLILGDPGVGKSAVIAQLVHTNPGGQVLAYHCCRSDEPDTLQPARFVRSMAAMIASRLPEYAAQLESEELQRRLSEDACERNPAGAFEYGVLAPLERLPSPSIGVRYLLVDALDEALSLREPAPNIVQLLAPRVERLPGWLRLVATSRRDPEVLQRLSGLRAETLDAQRSENLSDVDCFLSTRLASPELLPRLAASNVSPADVQIRLRAAAAGNFLYVRQALQDVERGLHSFATLDDLPRGLEGIYRDFFERRVSAGGEIFRALRPVLEVIVAARTPLSFEQLADVSGLDPDDQLRGALSTLAPFLSRPEGRYALYHSSFADWLTSTEGPFRINCRRGHESFVKLGLSRIVGGGVAAAEYNSVHLPHHLAACERWEEFGQLYSDPTFIRLLPFGEFQNNSSSRAELASALVHVLTAVPTTAWPLVQMVPRKLFEYGWDHGPRVGNFALGCHAFYHSVRIACRVSDADPSKRDWLAEFLDAVGGTFARPGFAEWFEQALPTDPYSEQLFFNAESHYHDALRSLKEQEG